MAIEALSRDEIDGMVAFAAARLEEDWNTAEAAGHGVHLEATERGSHMSVEWTRLQDEGNVRLIYDVRFLNRFGPRALVADIDRKCQILESGNVKALEILIQEWADHPKFQAAWRRDPAPGQLLARLEALRTRTTG
ncbi:hypothetical protein [Streptomyces sp. NPDC058861]|uniref:hypothetical protein n=1 Tax=Streptomyces sp. NPDC058861 TaxID=3346653 RepID=UPI0036B1A7B4